MEREEALADEAAVEPSQDVRVSGVELRMVGGRLNVKREMGKDLQVCCESRDKLCSVQFCRGEFAVAFSGAPTGPRLAWPRCACISYAELEGAWST